MNFIKQISAAYQSGVGLRDLLKAYLGFLCTRANFDVEAWQVEDMCMAVDNEIIDCRKVPLEVIWNKSRRSGKTMNATMLAVFYALLGYQVVWRTPKRNQFKSAMRWWQMNPFVTKIQMRKHLVHLVNGNTIDVAVMTPGNCTGIEADCVFFDEGGWVFKRLQVYEGYKQARPMIAPSDFKHILHFSTPARSTAFAEAWNRLKEKEKELGTKLTVTRTADDCPWISEEFVESEKEANWDCPWYVDQNYYGKFVVYGGAVFENILDIRECSNKDLLEKWNNVKPDVGGVDFNAPSSGHYLVKGKIFDDVVFLMSEEVFDEIEYLMDIGDIHLEVEDGGFNKPFADECRAIGLNNIRYEAWDEKSKMQRVRALQRRQIVVDGKECPITKQNIEEAAYDQNSRLPKLEKRSEQHGLDAALHLMGLENTYSEVIYDSAHKRGDLREMRGLGIL